MITFVILLAVLCTAFGECPNGCDLPITIYNDLKCRPIYATSDACCPSSYDCSHIFDHMHEGCHYRGKLYKLGDDIDPETTKGTCDRSCRCQADKKGELGFNCPPVMDGCAEFWVSGYPGPGCYLRHRPNECCADGQICPPFDKIAKCEVNGKTHKEGEVFDHPTKRCHKCSCKQGFVGRFEEPFCEEVECYAEIKNSGLINKNCAPYYKTSKSCCPQKWVCPNETGGIFITAINKNSADGPKCKFGKETIDIGGRYEVASEGDNTYCECVVPPFMTCGPERFKA